MTEWLSPYPGWVYATVALAIVGLLWLARRQAVSDRLRSWWLFAPRLIVFSLLLLILSNPARRQEHRLPPEPAEVDFLIDTSRSMALDDPEPRSSQVERVLQELDSFLTTEGAPRVQLYQFGQDLASVADWAELSPRADSSQLVEALEQLPSRFGRERPRAIVVFSDGRLDDADRIEEIAADYRSLQIPVHVYPVGDSQIRGDVAIEDLVLPSRVDAGAKVPVRGVLRSSGFAGERVVLQVVSAHRDDVEPLVTLPLTLDGSSQPFELIVDVRPEDGELLLEAVALEGEATRVNNRVPFQLAHSKRKIRVLYMEGTANNEYRWVRDALQEDPDMECLAMVADQQYVARQRLVRVDDPYRGFPATRAELMKYDCVICSDISLGAFTREQLEWTVELVAEHGGGFAMVGGITSFGAGGWDQTAWDQLIPVDMAGGVLGRGWVYHPFRVEIPAEARLHPIWRILEDPQANEIALASIPQFYGTNYMQRLKPAATTLAVSSEPIPGIGIMPIFASQPYGRGRTFAFAPDTTEDWGRSFEREWGEGDNRYFRRFWRNVVRWLTENSSVGGQRLRVETDRVLYRSGQTIRLTARALDEQLQASQAYRLTANLRAEDGTEVAIDLPMTASSSNDTYEKSLDLSAYQHLLQEDTSAGVRQMLELEVVAHDGSEEFARASTKVQVLPDLHEFLEPQPDPEMLANLARATQGRVAHSSDDLIRWLQQLPITQPDAIVTRQPLWDRPLIWLCLLMLLTFEWTLRRRLGSV